MKYTKSKQKIVDKFCINGYRLKSKYDQKEWIGINFLLGDINSSYISVDEIKDLILCMNSTDSNYNNLLDNEKKLVDKLRKNEEVVNIVLFTLFQWFGTSVGKDEIGRLLDKIRCNKNDTNI